ncbi:MAG: cation:proton antiporter [Epsilonproteobacteria bacterium]|nr:MAG: cation:proton antiporter [Campylobacterota bacterium]
MHHDLWLYSTIVILLIVAAKILSAKTRTVDVLWLILFGSIAVNIGILPKEHQVIEAIGEWGIVFVMFALGFDENLSNFMRGLKKSMGIAIVGALFPFLAGFYTAGFFGFDFYSQMIWGLTMTATAVSLTMVSLKDENLHKSTAATAIMTAAVVDDVLSLIGLSILIPIILSAGEASSVGFDIGSLGIIIIKVILFFSLMSFIGLILFPDSLAVEKNKKHSIVFDIAMKVRHELGIRKLLVTQNGKFTPVIMILIAFIFGLLAEIFGFHPAIGAYFGGLFLKGEYFNFSINEEIKSHQEDAKYIMDHLAFTIFGPIFFLMLGTKLLFDVEILSTVLLPIFVLFISVLVFQVLAASMAARWTGKYKWHESVMIGFGMLGRAELAFIVINIAYAQNHIISLEQFYILIGVVFLLNMTVPSAIKWWKPYYLGKKQLKLFGIQLSRKENIWKDDI